MGNKLSNIDSYQDFSSFKPGRISKFDDNQIKNIYLDNVQFPNSGIIIIGKQFVENYNETGNKMFSVFKSPYKITSTALRHSTNQMESILAIATEQSIVYLLSAKSLITFQKLLIIFEPADIQVKFHELEIKCNVENYFTKAYIDTILFSTTDSILIGLNTGFILQYSISTLMKIRILNPFEFELSKNIKQKEFSVENALVPGIESIVYGNIAELVFVNHKREFVNCLDRALKLDEAPICLYKSNGDPMKKLLGMKGDILACAVLENRSLYICLSSQENQMFVWNYNVGQIIMKVCCDISKEKSYSQFFTNMILHEFEMNQRYLSLQKILSINKIKTESENFLPAKSKKIDSFGYSMSGNNNQKALDSIKIASNSNSQDSKYDKSREEVKSTITATSNATTTTNISNKDQFDQPKMEEIAIEQKDIIDGDIIFNLNSNGAILISKLSYEDDKGMISWTPLKFLDTKSECKDKQEWIQKNIQSKFISCMAYDHWQDRLYFADQAGEIKIFGNIIKNTLMQFDQS